MQQPLRLISLGPEERQRPPASPDTSQNRFDFWHASERLENKIRRAAFYFTWGSVVSILFSIALSQFLLALALMALVVSGQRLRLPPIKLPLTLFFLVTIAAVLSSADPYGGLPQIRKFFVFGTLLVVFNTFKTLTQIRTMLLAWTSIAVASASTSFIQLAHRHRLALEQNAN